MSLPVVALAFLVFLVAAYRLYGKRSHVQVVGDLRGVVRRREEGIIVDLESISSSRWQSMPSKTCHIGLAIFSVDIRSEQPGQTCCLVEHPHKDDYRMSLKPISME